ncbi:MAG: GNAT family N-acetyltransferase [Deltaproteobacteria bacterium]|nr:GNAT family N-acetyltransferase [Deltaproteobacteria bacterium]
MRRHLPQQPLPAQPWLPGRGLPHPAASPPGAPLPAARWRDDDGWLWGVDLWNAGFPWEAHEAWEALWRGATGAQRELLQGLIQCAAAAVKLAVGAPGPAATLAARGTTRLLALPALMGVEPAAFAHAVLAWLASPAATLETRPRLELPMRRVLATPRLHVRELALDDLDDLAGLCGDAHAMRFVGDNRPLSRAQSQQWIERSLTNYRERPHGFGTWAVCARRDGAFVGYAGVVYPEPEPELIYGLLPARWGHGLGTEVARGVLEYALARVPTVIATVDPANTASKHILGRLGFQPERTGVDEHGLPTKWWRARATTVVR